MILEPPAAPGEIVDRVTTALEELLGVTLTDAGRSAVIAVDGYSMLKLWRRYSPTAARQPAEGVEEPVRAGRAPDQPAGARAVPGAHLEPHSLEWRGDELLGWP